MDKIGDADSQKTVEEKKDESHLQANESNKKIENQFEMTDCNLNLVQDSSLNLDLPKLDININIDL